DHRALGDDAHRVAELAEDFERTTRELVQAFDRLITVGGRADRNEFTAPGWLPKLSPQNINEVRLYQNHRRELIVGTQFELRVVAARVAVVTAVRAATIGIQRPLERHPLDRIERRA